MAIPYNKCLDWGKQGDKVSISGQYKTPAYEDSSKGQLKRAVHALFIETVTQLGVRSLQFTRDLARLILKVPIRSVITPIILPKNWPERRRVVLNIQLTGNSLLR